MVLRGLVAGGADERLGVAQVGDEPDVGQHGAAADEEDVGGLDVAVREVAGLEELERPGEAEAEREAVAERERDLGLEDGGERAWAVDLDAEC